MEAFENTADERVCFSVVRTGVQGSVDNPEYLEGLSRHFNMTILESYIRSELYVANAPPPPAPPARPGSGILEEGYVANCPAGQESILGECRICRKGGYCVGSEFVRCPSGTWANVTGRNASDLCLQCPKDVKCTRSDCQQGAISVDCTSGVEVVIRVGFFAHSPYSKWAFPCANRANCQGGRPAYLNGSSDPRSALQFGEATCAPGHKGNLCGRCESEWYRARRVCKPCDEQRNKKDAWISDTVLAMSIIVPFGVIATVIVILVYLQVWTPSLPEGKYVRFAEAKRRADEWFRLHINDHLPVATGLFKIVLSYCQCLSAISRFDRIAWPTLFDSFLRVLEELTIEIFTLLPVECVKGDRLGFGFELLVTLSLPISYFVGLYSILCLAYVRPWRLRQGFKQSLEKLNSARSYKLITLAMLVTCKSRPYQNSGSAYCHPFRHLFLADGLCFTLRSHPQTPRSLASSCPFSIALQRRLMMHSQCGSRCFETTLRSAAGRVTGGPWQGWVRWASFAIASGYPWLLSASFVAGSGLMPTRRTT